MIATLTRHQVRSLRRERTFAVFLGSFVLITVMAAILGYSSSSTIVRVYDEATRLLASSGQPAPPNPFDLKPTLALLSNMTIYVPFIGAILAALFGHSVVVEDKASGIGRIIFTRPLSRSTYLVSKLLASAVALAIVVIVGLAISAAAVFLINGTISVGDTGRLALFFALSWAYLFAFVLLGMATVLLARRRATALLIALGVWVVITFAIPQVTSGIRPVASLNPIAGPAGASEPFFRVTSNLRPLSFSEEFKTASATILQTGERQSLGATLGHVAPLLVTILLLGALCLYLVQRHDYSRSGADD